MKKIRVNFILQLVSVVNQNQSKRELYTHMYAVDWIKPGESNLGDMAWVQ